MSKTKEELNDIKNQIIDLQEKLSQLSEDELKEITGASETILPKHVPEMWESFNPNSYETGQGLNPLDFLIKSNNVNIKKAEFNGHLENREDDAQFIKK